jgi:hypothetical protein
VESNVLANKMMELEGRGVKRGDRVCVMCKFCLPKATVL